MWVFVCCGMWRWGVMEPSGNGRGHMQILLHAHILIWLIDPQESVSLYCSFCTWYLYYVIIYQLYHVGQVYLFFVPRMQHGENIYGCISIALTLDACYWIDSYYMSYLTLCWWHLIGEDWPQVTLCHLLCRSQGEHRTSVSPKQPIASDTMWCQGLG